MSVNTRRINASPEEVFDVLADGLAYGYWVVGPTEVVSVDESWPAVGSSFVHQHGRGPLTIKDETTVLALDSRRMLELHVKIRPLGMEGQVTFVLEPLPGGTMVEMREAVTGGYVGAIWNPLFDRLMWARNLQSLQRLKDLVERRSARPESSPDAPPSGRPPLAVAGGAVTAVAFWTLSNLRSKRVFHPVGALHEAELEITGDETAGASFLREGGRYPALVRRSRGIGLPHAMPDILGLAIKIPDRYGPGADQDLLLASSGEGIVGRRLLHLRRGTGRSWFSSILAYDAGTSTVLVGARPTSGSDAFTLYVAEASERWRAIGTLELGSPTDRSISFDPWHTGPDFTPVGLLNELRAPAYQGSRRGRADSASADGSQLRTG